MKTFGKWVLTVLFFMVYLPILFVIQAIITPIELIVNFIRFGRCFTPDMYWSGMSKAIGKMSDACSEIGDEL